MDKNDLGLFPLGRRVATRNALALLGEAGVDPNRLFERHAGGDWGVIEGKSWYLNRLAVDGGYGSVASACTWACPCRRARSGRTRPAVGGPRSCGSRMNSVLP